MLAWHRRSDCGQLPVQVFPQRPRHQSLLYFVPPPASLLYFSLSRAGQRPTPPPTFTQIQHLTMSPRVISMLYGFTRSDVMGVLIPTVRRCRCRYRRMRIILTLVIPLGDTY